MTTAKGLVSPDFSESKVKLSEKISLLMIAMGTAPILSLMTSFLMIYYIDIIGLSPIVVGTLFLISRVFDAVNDPISGYVLDHLPRSRMGKFRLTLIIGAILCSINYLLVWMGPAWSPVGKVAIAYISYLLIGFTYDIMDISKNSMIPVMTTNMKERGSLSAFFAFGSIFGALLVSVVTPMILKAGGQGLPAYQTLIIGAIAFTMVMTITGGLGVKERVAPTKEDKKYSLKQYFGIFAQRPVLALLGSNLLYGLAMYLPNGVNMFFYTYVMKDISLLSMQMMLGMLGMIPGIIFSGKIASKLGNKNTMVMAFILMTVSSLVRLISPTSLILIYGGSILTNFCTGLALTTIQVMQSETIDFIEYKLKYRAEGAIASITTFISKFGASIAGAFPGFLLAIAGYIPNAENQPASAVTAIVACLLTIPAVFSIAAMFTMGFGYNLNKKKYSEISDELKERRIASKMDSTVA